MVNIFPDAQVGVSREGCVWPSMKQDRKADDKPTTQRPAEDPGMAQAAPGATDSEASAPRPGEPGCLSPLHAPTKR